MHRRVFIFFSRVLWYTIVYFEKTLPKEVLKMKAHIARNQNAGVPLALGWNLSPADRGKLEGMAPAFGMAAQFPAKPQSLPLPLKPSPLGGKVARSAG